MEPEEKKNSPLAIGGALVLVLLVAAFGVFKYMKKDSTESSPAETPATATVEIPADVPVAINRYLYKDGTYSSIGNYVSPGGDESINVTLTLKDDVITDAKVVSNATRPNSVKFQGQFISGFKVLVVGKKLSEVSLDKVSGSSLTPKGFNDALSEIKTQAQV